MMCEVDVWVGKGVGGGVEQSSNFADDAGRSGRRGQIDS